MLRVFIALLSLLVAAPLLAGNWYEESFWLLHEDHHTSGTAAVGRDASLAETRRLVDLCRPDVIQIHAKGNPGWTTYPSTIGHTPPKLASDVLDIWRRAARQGGYRFSAYYNLGRDGQIMEHRPQWNRVKANGEPWERALCYHSGVAEAYLWPMISEIIEGYHPDGFWFDGSCFTITNCYCQACRKRFARESGSEPPVSPDSPQWTAYQEMQREIYREFLAATVAHIHRLDPQCLVAVNWAYSLRMPEKPPEGIAYLTGDIGNGVEGLSGEAHWYDGQDLPFDLMTQIMTMKKRPDRQGSDPVLKPQPQIEQEMAVIVANGGRYFAWDNPTPESRIVPERFESMAQVITPFLRSRQPWCLGTTRLPDVSLLHDASSHYAANDTTSVAFSKSNNRIAGAQSRLNQMHLNFEMVADWRLAKGDVRSGLLVAEHAARLTADAVDAMAAYLEKGGRLLVTGMGPLASPRLQQLLGIKHAAGAKNSERLIVNELPEKPAFDHWLMRVEPAGGETLLSVSDSQGQRHPYLVRHRVGRGEAFYVASPLLADHGPNIVPAAVLEHVFDEVLPAAERRLVVDAPSTVEAVLRQKDSSLVVHLVNMSAGTREVATSQNRRYPLITAIEPVQSSRLSVAVPGQPLRVHLEPQGATIDNWRVAGGRLELDVPPWNIHQMVVVDLAPQATSRLAD